MKYQQFIEAALREDVGAGDYSTLASISPTAKGAAALKIKEDGILAGVAVAKEIFEYLQPDVNFLFHKKDGDKMKVGEVAFELEGNIHTLLTGERLALNCMQRMSGIATLTAEYVALLEGYKTQILDTRKTTPLFRALEKEAVRIGGGTNHRMGLYDMVMLKDNHVDFCGGIGAAITQTIKYLELHNLNLPIVIETRNLADIKEVLKVGGVQRIMLDNFSPQNAATALLIIDGRYETEASGGITKNNIQSYAAAGVDYISVGAITHHAVSLDLSFKAQLA